MKPGRWRSVLVVAAALSGAAGGCTCVDLSHATFEEDDVGLGRADAGGADAGGTHRDAGPGGEDAADEPDAESQPREDAAVRPHPDAALQPPCIIADASYPPGAYNPAAYCQRCEPSMRTDDWSQVSMGPCRTEPGGEDCTGSCSFGNCHWDGVNGTRCGTINASVCSAGWCAPAQPLLQLTPVADGTMDHDMPTVPFGGETTLEVSPTKSTVIRFDLSSISGHYVSNAKLTLVPAGVGGVAQATLYRLSRSFVEHEVTWNDASSSTAWELGGAKGNSDRDYNSKRMDPLTCTSYTPVILDFTNEAKAWAEYPLMNAGMLFEETASVGGACVFNSKEATAATQRPVLEVTYY